MYYAFIIFVILDILALYVFFINLIWSSFNYKIPEVNCKKEIDDATIAGEKVGFERGFESGRLESRNEFKIQFINFLEEQLKVLKDE